MIRRLQSELDRALTHLLRGRPDAALLAVRAAIGLAGELEKDATQTTEMCRDAGKELQRRRLRIAVLEFEARNRSLGALMEWEELP